MGNGVASLGSCLFTIVAFIVVVGGTLRIWWPVLVAHMSSQPITPAVIDVTGTIPVSNIGITDYDETPVLDRLDAVSPVSRHMSDVDIIVLLASQKKDTGLWRFGVNKVYALTGGNRNDVLDLISQVRAGQADFVSDTIARVQREVDNGA